MSADTPKTILFVCTGNTCRSPMAEFLMADRCKHLHGWSFASAGIFASPGAPPSPLAVQVLKEHRLDLSPHRARTLTPDLIRQAHLLIAMTRAHRDLILELDPAATPKTHTLHSFGSEKPHADVLDPFSGNIDTYRIARDDIAAGLNDLILAVLQPPKP